MSENIEDLIWINENATPLEIIVYLYIDLSIPKIASISKFPVPEFVESGFRELRLISRWSIPDRAEMESYRRQSSTFNIQLASVMVDELALSDCVVTHHMVGLSIDGKDIELERDESLVLTVESLKKLKFLHSGLYDLMYNTYKAEACLFT